MDRGDHLQANKKRRRVQIFVNGRDYYPTDTFSKIYFFNTFVRVTQSIQSNESREIFRTKIYKNSCSPKYTDVLVIDCYYEKFQYLTFEVFQEGYQSPFGVVQRLPLLELILKSFSQHELKEKEGGIIGKLRLYCEKIEELKEGAKVAGTVSLKNFCPQTSLSCIAHENKKVFFEIIRPLQKLEQYNQEIVVYKSEPKEQNKKNVQWEFQVSQHKLCLNKLNSKFCFKFFLQTHTKVVIGACTFSLIKENDEVHLQLNEEKKDYSCAVQFKRFNQTRFLDYIKRGLKLSPVICIDFTQSNGEYQDQNSLHCFAHGQSAYEKVFHSLFKYILEYSQEKQIAILGFGAKVYNPWFHTQGRVSHCFPLNMDEKYPKVSSYEELIQNYREYIPSLEFSGPTCFSATLKWAKKELQKMKEKGEVEYMVLFILTDGWISDYEQTTQCLEEISNLPISIAIVGIGKEDFRFMETLFNQEKNGKRNFTHFIKFQNEKKAEQRRQLTNHISTQLEKFYQL